MSKSTKVEGNRLSKTAAKRLGYTFKNPELLLQAITHKSFSNEALPDDTIEHNQRLEFLGDAVLNLVVSEMLLTQNPELDEGQLSRQRAFVVNQRELAQAATDVDLGELMRLGKGEERSGGRNKESLLADLYEAMLGAIYLEGGLKKAKKFVHKTLGKQLSSAGESNNVFDPKSRLQELFQQDGRPCPHYQVIKSEGPDHQRRFTVAIMERDCEIGRGEGHSKKAAEQEAASQVLRKFHHRLSPGDSKKESSQ